MFFDGDLDNLSILVFRMNAFGDEQFSTICSQVTYKQWKAKYSKQYKVCKHANERSNADITGIQISEGLYLCNGPIVGEKRYKSLDNPPLSLFQFLDSVDSGHCQIAFSNVMRSYKPSSKYCCTAQQPDWSLIGLQHTTVQNVFPIIIF